MFSSRRRNSNNNENDKIIDLSGEFTTGLSSYLSFFARRFVLCRAGVVYPSFVLFTHSLVRRAKRATRRTRRRGGTMKNLQNYAKNVQLVKRNIILCVASFYIASFPLDWDNAGVLGVGDDTTMNVFSTMWKGENEREAMSIMKYILLKWRRARDEKK